MLENDWIVTSRLESQDGVFGVEHNGRLGYAKYGRKHKEKLAADLAALVEVPVPKVEFGLFGGEQISVSHVQNGRRYPLRGKLLDLRPLDSTESAALRRASGLLAFLHWIAAEDHGHDTNLVVNIPDHHEPNIVAIDFEDAFRWKMGKCAFGECSEPPGLRDNVDKERVAASLKKIECLTRQQISDCCKASGMRAEQANEIAETLVLRQSLLRQHLHLKGWIG